VTTLCSPPAIVAQPALIRLQTLSLLRVLIGAFRSRSISRLRTNSSFLQFKSPDLFEFLAFDTGADADADCCSRIAVEQQNDRTTFTSLSIASMIVRRHIFHTCRFDLLLLLLPLLLLVSPLVFADSYQNAH
jgi:hypothetical protein